MIVQKPINYTNEFKRDLVQLLLLSKKSHTQLEKEWNIDAGLLLKWKAEIIYENDGFCRHHDGREIRSQYSAA